MPWWLAVLAIWIVSRVITTAIMLSFAARQGENAWTGASPGYLDFARLWDGHWYYIISVVGYPAEIPRDAEGRAGENAWAFMPVYPGLIRIGMVLTGDFSPQGFALVAVTISVLASAAAALVFYLLARRWLTHGTALLAVAVLCTMPLSPVLQVAYAESLHLAVLFAALLLVLDRHWRLLAPVVTVMALIRPSGLAFALLLVLIWGWRWLRRERDTFTLRERCHLGLTAVIAGLAGLAWPAIVALRTGDLFAYTDTELAWRRPYIGDVHLVPFTPWWQGSQWWLGEVLGPVILIAVLILAASAFALPAMRATPMELRLWVAAYSLYLLAVFFPQSSTFRLLLPIVPVVAPLAAGIVAVGSGTVGRQLSPTAAQVVRMALAVVAIGVGIVGQFGWVHIAWWVDGYDWTPP